MQAALFSQHPNPSPTLEGFEDDIHRSLRRTILIRILDAKHKNSVVVAGKKPIKKRGPGTTYMQVTCWTRCKTHPDLCCHLDYPFLELPVNQRSLIKQSRQTFGIRRLDQAFFGNDASYVLSWRHIEGGIKDIHPFRCDWNSRQLAHLCGRALRWECLAIGGRQIDG